jgi:hypothetical protein
METKITLAEKILKISEELQISNDKIYDMGGKSNKSGYASLPNLHKMLRPLLIKYQVITLINTEIVDGHIMTTLTIQDASIADKTERENGQYKYYLPLEKDRQPGMQGWGAARTYSHRYLLYGAFCVAPENVDDSGDSFVDTKTGKTIHAIPIEEVKF